MREIARRPLLPELEDDLLGTIDEIGDFAFPLLAQTHDLLARADEPAQGRHLLDDARVVLDVRGGRDERCGSAMRACPPAASSSARSSSSLTSVMASTGSPFDHRERAARHLRVALAVEVGRIENLADRSHRDGREQHRAENRLLRLRDVAAERRRSGARRLARARCGSRRGSQASRTAASNGTMRRLPCRENRTYVPMLSPTADDLSTGRRGLSSRKHALRARVHAVLNRGCGWTATWTRR